MGGGKSVTTQLPDGDEEPEQGDGKKLAERTLSQVKSPNSKPRAKMVFSLRREKKSITEWASSKV